MDGDMVPIPDPREVADFDLRGKVSPSEEPYIEENLDIVTLSPGAQCVGLLHKTGNKPDLPPLSLESETGAPDNTLYRIAKAGTSGLRVFARMPIEPGQLIMRERPLLVYPQLVPFNPSLPPEHAYPKLEEALLRLHECPRAAFFLLANSHSQEPSRVKGIIDTNALHIGQLPGSTLEYAGVCKDVSRINHR